MAIDEHLRQCHSEVLSRIFNTPGIVPAHRAAYRQGYSFSKEPFEKQLPVWNYIWKHSSNIWPKIHAFFFLEQYVKKTELLGAIWETSRLWQEEVNDWGLCDALAKINTKAL
jgi:hypothetical protein